MTNADYWRKRFEILEEAMNRNAGRAVQGLEPIYAEIQREVDDLIYAWQGRFAKNNNITMAEAQKWLNVGELAEFKWSVEDYIKYGQENALNGKWMKQLENASTRVHISRLEALKIQTQQSIEKLTGKELEKISTLMEQTYRDGYYRTVFELQKGAGIGWDIASLDERQIESVLSKPWTTDGQTFSDRIWVQKEKLIDAVHKEITKNAFLGRSPDASIKAIAKEFQTTKANAARLIHTESSFFAAEAEHRAYKDLDVERYEILVSLDEKTCPICSQYDGKVFETKDFEPGVTAEPFHPRCRCTTIPHYDDLGGERVARGADGKTYKIPGDMKYSEWKEKFVEGGDKKGLTVSTNAVKLTDSEEMSIRDYISAKSYSLNAELRDGIELNGDEKTWVKSLDSALDKMPKHEGVAYRSLSDAGIGDISEFVKSHIPGQELSFPAYTSTSKTIYDETFPIQYIIESKTGRDLGDFNMPEAEVLFPRGSKFRIVKVDKNTIYMEEL